MEIEMKPIDWKKPIEMRTNSFGEPWLPAKVIFAEPGAFLVMNDKREVRWVALSGNFLVRNVPDPALEADL